MEHKIEQQLKDYSMLAGCDKLLLACSGGADSSAMLDFFAKKAEEYGLTVYAAHFNHKLRGAESDRDEAFVTEQCNSRGIQLYKSSRDVALFATQGKISIEMAARQARYEFLEETAAKLEAKIATGHHAGDNLETMLLNLTRGTGLRGLCGIPPVRDRIIRPLLFCTKEEIIDYCKKNKLEFITDSSNFSVQYSRNRIRSEVLPVLSGLNPKLLENTAKTSAWLREDENLLSQMAAALLKESATGSRLEAGKLLASPRPIRRRALAAFIFSQTGIHPDSRDLEVVEDVLQGGKQLLFGNWYLVCRKGIFWVADYAAIPVQPVEICEGENQVGTKKMIIFRQSGKNIDKIPFKSSLSCDKIKGTLWAGSRPRGASFHPVGRGVGKSLKKLFWESGIPAEQRDGLIVLSDDEGVVWIEGFGPDERCKPLTGVDFYRIIISTVE